MFDSVIILCTGNICRSPMAAGLLQHLVHLRGHGPQVDSAGLRALVGAPADPVAVSLLAERGINISAHRARQANEELLRRHALILVMEHTQQEFVESTWPALHGRVFRWGHWQDFDVTDPYSRDESAFRETLSAIDRGLAGWTKKLGIADV
ncbi:MAG: low molecular weight protein-tyrosine-phosphatase [Gammaproteobacteria bacterium]